MRHLTVGQASTCVLLTLSSLLHVTSAWPSFDFYNSQFAKRADATTPRGSAPDDDASYNEVYDFVIAGGMFRCVFPIHTTTLTWSFYEVISVFIIIG